MKKVVKLTKTQQKEEQDKARQAKIQQMQNQIKQQQEEKAAAELKREKDIVKGNARQTVVEIMAANPGMSAAKAIEETKLVMAYVYSEANRIKELKAGIPTNA